MDVILGPYSEFTYVDDIVIFSELWEEHTDAPQRDFYWWLTRWAPFEFVIENQPGKLHSNADGLSWQQE